MPVLPGPDQLGTQNPRAARGQPSYRASPVGGALQGFGQALGSLGATVMQDEAQRKSELDKTEAFGVQSRIAQFDANWTKQFEERKANVAPGAAGLSESFLGDYRKAASEFMGTVPVPLRQQADLKLGAIEDSFTTPLNNFQRTEAFRYGQEKVTDGLNSKLTRLARDPNQWEVIQKEGEDLINSNPAYSPVQRDEAIREWTKNRRIARFDINQKINGVSEVSKLGVTPGGNKPVSANVNGVYQGLKERLPPMQAAVMAGNIQQESGGNPSSLNKKEGAHGILQWRLERWTALKNFAASGGRDPNDINTQLDFIMFEGTGAEKAAFDQFLSAGTPAEANRALKGYIRYGDDSEGTRLQNAIAIAGGKDMNQGQGPTIANAQRQGVPVEPDADYAGIDYFTRVKMYDDAIKTDQKEFSNQVEDYSAYLRSGGAPQGDVTPGAPTGVPQDGMQQGSPSGPQGDFSLPNLQQRLGPDAGQKVYDQLQQDAAFGTTLNEIRMASPERVATILSQAQEALSTPTDFKDNAAIYAGVTSAIDTRKTAIESDPAGYVIKNDPQVAQAWQNIEPGGQGYAAALKTTADSQASIGVPPDQIAPLRKDHAARAVSIFKNVDLPDEQRLAPLSPIIFGSTDPARPTTTRDQQQAVFQQLVKAGLPDIAEGAMEAAARGDSGAAQRLFEAVMVDPSKIGKTSSNPKQIMAQIQSDIMDTGEIGDVAYGLSFGNVSNYERARRDTELMQRSVQLRMVNGVTDLAGAVAAVKKDLFGDRTPINITSPVQASVLLPQGTDASMIGHGLTEATSQFRAALEATGGQLTTENIPASDGSRAIVQAATTNSINRVMDTGVFRNVGDGIGLFDPYTSLFVAGVDGRPLVISIDAILRLGATAPTADTAERSNVKKQIESMAPSSDGGY